VQHPPFEVGATQIFAVVYAEIELHSGLVAPVWTTQFPNGQLAPVGVVATVPVPAATLAEASPVLRSTVMVPRLALPERVRALPVVDAALKLRVATVVPPESCTKQPKATPLAAMVTETSPAASAVPEAAVAGDPNVTQ
jgi:hypothetical protein